MNIGYRISSPYAVICKWVTPEEISSELPKLIGEVSQWLREKNKDLSGAPFFEYRVMNAGRIHVCVGFPVPEPIEGDERVHAGAFPEGEYASTIYTGPYSNLLSANERLNTWFQSEGYEQRFLENNDQVFSGSRTEFYLTDPAVETDQSKWKTEIAVWVKRRGK